MFSRPAMKGLHVISARLRISGCAAQFPRLVLTRGALLRSHWLGQRRVLRAMHVVVAAVPQANETPFLQAILFAPSVAPWRFMALVLACECLQAQLRAAACSLRAGKGRQLENLLRRQDRALFINATHNVRYHCHVMRNQTQSNPGPVVLNFRHRRFFVPHRAVPPPPPFLCHAPPISAFSRCAGRPPGTYACGSSRAP